MDGGMCATCCWKCSHIVVDKDFAEDRNFREIYLPASDGIAKSDCGNATARLFHHNLLAFVDIYALCQAVIVFHCGILLGYGAV